MRLRLTIEYDGSRFRGWATQPNLRTVEGVVRDALGWVYDSWERLAVAGRTDTGVHALGQVASVDVEGGPPSTSTLATCASACTPVSVLPATARRSHDSNTHPSASRITPSTVRRFGCTA